MLKSPYSSLPTVSYLLSNILCHFLSSSPSFPTKLLVSFYLSKNLFLYIFFFLTCIFFFSTLLLIVLLGTLYFIWLYNFLFFFGMLHAQYCTLFSFSSLSPGYFFFLVPAHTLPLFPFFFFFVTFPT